MSKICTHESVCIRNKNTKEYIFNIALRTLIAITRRTYTAITIYCTIWLYMFLFIKQDKFVIKKAG